MEKRFIALKPFNNKIFYKNALFKKSWSGSIYLRVTRELLAKKNIELNTIDITTTGVPEKYVYMDVPYPWEFKLWLKIIKNRGKNILYIVEPPIVNPFNYFKIFSFLFTKIYTWNNNLVDNVKYFKYLLPIATLDHKTENVPFKEKMLLILISTNFVPVLPFKILSWPNKELYSERIKAINFFDKYHPSQFSLYGRGWNSPSRFSIKQKIFGYKKYKTYQGEFHSKDKYKILSKFRFCLCFENNEIKGNISEKIMDCFKSKCIPVYRGAINIGELISKDCYIDALKFKNYEDLYQYLMNMKEEEYNKYIRNIQQLLARREFQEKWLENGFAKFFLKSLKS